MERRLHMTSRDKTLMVEGSVKFYDGRPGMEVLTQIRKYNPKFKYARIKDVIQAYPDKIKLGKIYKTDYPEGVELQSLVDYIDRDDVELLEAAGVPEGKEK